MTKKPLVDLNDHPSHDWKGLEHMHQRPGTDNDGPQLLSCVWLFGTPWTVACRIPLSMGFSRQEYWGGLPFPPPGDCPNPGIEGVASHPLSSQGFASSIILSPSFILSYFLLYSIKSWQYAYSLISLIITTMAQKVYWYTPGAGVGGGLGTGQSFSLGKWKIQEMDDGSSQTMWMYVVPLNYIVTMLKRVCFMLCDFYHNRKHFKKKANKWSNNNGSFDLVSPPGTTPLFYFFLEKNFLKDLSQLPLSSSYVLLNHAPVRFLSFPLYMYMLPGSIFSARLRLISNIWYS